MTAISSADRDACAAHLANTVEIFSVLTNPGVGPVPGSSADQELAEAREFALGDGIWGEDPVRTAYAAALMSYIAALDEARAMAAVITGPVLTAIPAVVLARSLAEICSQAWWLLEAGTGARGRVERLQCFRLRSAIEGEAAAADEIDEADWPDYTETRQKVFEYSRKLGLDLPSKKGYVYVCGSQSMPTARPRIAQMFSDVGVKAVYNIQSGFAHGELFALWQGFEHCPDGQIMNPVVNEETLKAAIAVAARAVYCPAARLTILFGLAPTPVLDYWVDEHDAVTELPG